MCHLVLPRDSKRHPLNSADGSVVRYTKSYTLTCRVATATTLITIHAIPRHRKLKNKTPECTYPDRVVYQILQHAAPLSVHPETLRRVILKSQRAVSAGDSFRNAPVRLHEHRHRQHALAYVTERLNNRPRKRLNYLTPLETLNKAGFALQM